MYVWPFKDKARVIFILLKANVFLIFPSALPQDDTIPFYFRYLLPSPSSVALCCVYNDFFNVHPLSTNSPFPDQSAPVTLTHDSLSII